jgi:hypothetical protein
MCDHSNCSVHHGVEAVENHIIGKMLGLTVAGRGEAQKPPVVNATSLKKLLVDDYVNQAGKLMQQGFRVRKSTLLIVRQDWDLEADIVERLNADGIHTKIMMANEAVLIRFKDKPDETCRTLELSW